MGIEEAFSAFGSYDLWLVILGLAFFAIAVLPRVLADYPMTTPILLTALGFAAVALPLGLDAPDPKQHGDIAEHLTELGVIVAIMGAGLKIDRPLEFKSWTTTWRLLGITMVLSIGLVALVGWWVAAFVPASALLLGATIAPTDPVLASDVQVGSPGKSGEDEVTEDTQPTGHAGEDEVRFGLTSEAGLNDGLAFPFTNMALAMTIAGAYPGNWIDTWLLIDVLYKLGVAGIMGPGLGVVIARGVFAIPAETHLARSMLGLSALAATLLVYGATEYVGGYGFLATFFAAVTIRSYERDHEFHETFHRLTEKIERLLMAVILVAFGGAVAGGLLEPLDWPLVLTALILVFVVRPFAGIVGLVGLKRAPWRERLTISFFGIRGIGSLYYLIYAFNEGSFVGSDRLWAVVSLVILISIVVHGVAATPVTAKLDELRQRDKERVETREAAPARPPQD